MIMDRNNICLYSGLFILFGTDILVTKLYPEFVLTWQIVVKLMIIWTIANVLIMVLVFTISIITWL